MFREMLWVKSFGIQYFALLLQNTASLASELASPLRFSQTLTSLQF